MGATDLEKSTWGEYWPEITVTNILIILNLIGGIIILEWSWSKTARFRHPIAELNAQFPELARHDAPNWQKWKLYPGTFLIIPRFLWMMLIGTLLALLLNLYMIGHDKTQPLSGCRRFFCRYTLMLLTNMIVVVGFFTYLGYDRMSMDEVNDYEEYLGTVVEQG